MIRKDVPKARSLVQAARRDMAFTLSLPVSEISSATIIRNIYEAFRMLGEAMLSFAGIPSADHSQQLMELERLSVMATRPIKKVDDLRRIRNSINYRGYAPTLPEAKDALLFARECFSDYADAVEKEING